MVPRHIVMELKIRKLKNQQGVTFIEILIVLALILIAMSVVYMSINPLEAKKRGRDEKRISDLNVLDSAISEYVLDNGSYPDTANVTRTSSTLPTGSEGPLYNVTGQGWISQNMSNYMVKLPVDPINDATYHYSYRHTDTAYELNAVLEYNIELSQDDNGNDSGVYEIGNSLTVL